jgi:nucleotide-binding universal stress UspA family protein
MVEIRRILCPVDLSALSRHALDHALAIAAWYEARVTILHVHSTPQSLIVPSTGISEGLDALPLVPKPAEIVDEIRRFSDLTGSATASRAEVLVVDGNPAKEIVSLAERLPADLLVMGTHGRSGFEALFLGSVTEKVLRSTHVPVLTVPPPVEQVGSVAYKTILCPIEFSDPSTRALEYALTLAEETGARLILLHVVEHVVDASQLREVSHFTILEYQRHVEEDARARLRSAVPEEARVWCTPVERVMSGKAHRSILQVAKEENVEVIVMGVHGKGALNRRLFGSTTHHVIREARCPVLTLRG